MMEKLESDEFGDRLGFSYEMTFRIGGKGNKLSTYIWGIENSHITCENMWDSPKVYVFYAMSNKYVYEPLSLKE